MWDYLQLPKSPKLHDMPCVDQHCSDIITSRILVILLINGDFGTSTETHIGCILSENMLLLAASAASLLSWNSSLLRTVPLWPSSTSLRANSLFCRETGTQQRGVRQGDRKRPASTTDKHQSLSVWSFGVVRCCSCDSSYCRSYPSKILSGLCPCWCLMSKCAGFFFCLFYCQQSKTHYRFNNRREARRKILRNIHVNLFGCS